MNAKQNADFGCDGFKIVVLDKGFVYVGDVMRFPTGNVIIDNARNIRIWGTTKGLGQLARCGPQKDTVLDDVGTVLVPVHAIQHFIVTDKDRW